MSEFMQTTQLMTLALLLQDSTVASRVSGILKPESFFSNPVYQKLAILSFDFFNKFGEVPSRAALTSVLGQMLLKDKTLALYHDEFNKALDYLFTPLSLSDVDYTKDNLETNIKSSEMQAVVINGVATQLNGKLSEFAAAVQSVADFKLEDETDTISFDTFDRHSYINSEYNLPVPTGFATIDDEMQGGHRPGKTGIIIGFTGRGKSQVLLNFGANAMKVGRRVLHITMENSKEETMQRYDACLFDENFWDLQLDAGKNAAVQSRIPEFLKNHPTAQLTIIFRPSLSLTVPQLKALIKRKFQNKLFPELIIVDYADLLLPTKYYDNSYNDYGLIYAQLVSMAQEFNVPLWTASQANRRGGKAALCDLDHTSDSIKKAFVADVVYAITQSDDDKLHYLLFLYSCKMRNHDHGRKHYFNTKFARAKLLSVSKDAYTTIQSAPPKQKSLIGEVGKPGSTEGWMTNMNAKLFKN